jgi:hypothetical protein
MVNGAVGQTAPTARRAGAAPASSAFLRFAGGGRRIPSGFFGLSIEYTELPVYERSAALFAQIISLIRPRDSGPLTLRVGGKSADHALWEPPTSGPIKLPRGVFKINQTWLTDLGQLARLEDLRVILDLNLAVHSTTTETNFVAAAQEALPPHGLAGLEIGNEPDMYHYQPPLQRQHVLSTDPAIPLRWWRNYSPAAYRRDYTSYARSLKTVASGVTLGAPDIVSDEPPWLASTLRLGRLSPGFLAVHRYASSTCAPRSSTHYPTIPRLLSKDRSTHLAASLRGPVTVAHSHHLSLRLTEVNSVSCGGNPGVANSFATALWAPDALFDMIKDGVSGVNWHIRLKTLNAPFHFGRGGIEALPELYALALFTQMTHGPATLLGTTLTASPTLNLKAWAVRKGDTVSVLLINKGRHSARVAVPARSGARAAVVRRLLAPSVRAIGGVRFAGRRVGSDGRWHGRERTPLIHTTNGTYHVFVPGYSAALVTMLRGRAA